MTTTQETQPIRTTTGDGASSRLPVRAVRPLSNRAKLLAALLGVLTTIGVFLGVGRSDPGYEGTQVLGVVSGAEAASDGALSSAKQWAAVSSSVPFVVGVANTLRIDDGELRRALTITAVESAPVVTVKATGTNEERIRTVIGEVTKELGDNSAKADKRYPLKPLTDIAVVRGRGTSAPVALGMSVVAGLAVAAAALMLLRWLNKRAAEHD